MNSLEGTVLIVEDEFVIRELFRLQVEELGLTVCGCASTAADAIALAKKHQPGVVLMDMRLRGAPDGVDAALVIHESVGSKVIFITGSREPETLARIGTDHPAKVLFKPLSPNQLQNALREALAR
jgi:CheY-like chemotaxis protein